MTEKLLPCPFCGGEATVIIAHSPIKSAFVDCGLCDVSGTIYELAQEAISAWNRRAAQPAASTNPVAWVSPTGFSRLCHGRPVQASPIDRGGDIPIYTTPVAAQPSVPEWSEAMADAGFSALDDRGFRVGASDLGVDDIRAVFYAMLAAAPAPPADGHCDTCNDNGIVGNILNAEPCPDCTPPADGQVQPAVDWEAMYEQMCERCDYLDGKLAEYEAQPAPVMTGDEWLGEHQRLKLTLVSRCEKGDWTGAETIANELSAHARKRVQPASGEDAFAGVHIWMGGLSNRQHVNATSIQNERVTGSSLTEACQRALNGLAAMKQGGQP